MKRVATIILVGFGITVVVALFLGEPSERQASRSSTGADGKASIKSQLHLDSYIYGPFVLRGNFTIRNDATVAIKDPVIQCNQIGPSGSVIRTHVQTLYRVIAPKSTEAVSYLTLGARHEQTYKVDCRIADFSL